MSFGICDSTDMSEYFAKNRFVSVFTVFGKIKNRLINVHNESKKFKHFDGPNLFHSVSRTANVLAENHFTLFGLPISRQKKTNVFKTSKNRPTVFSRRFTIKVKCPTITVNNFFQRAFDEKSRLHTTENWAS